MLQRLGTGKGLDIKAKSFKATHAQVEISGFVPFVQIYEDVRKGDILSWSNFSVLTVLRLAFGVLLFRR